MEDGSIREWKLLENNQVLESNPQKFTVRESKQEKINIEIEDKNDQIAFYIWTPPLRTESERQQGAELTHTNWKK